MAKNSIIYIPDLNSDQVIWISCDDKGRVESKPQGGALEEVAGVVAGSKVVVIIPSSQITLAYAKVPGSRAKAQAAIPYALEDILCDDVDDLHFVSAEKAVDKGYPVAVISHSLMASLMSRFEQANLRPTAMYPEVLTVPYAESSESIAWSALIDEERFILRTETYNGFAIEKENAGFALDKSIQDLQDTDKVPQSLILHSLSDAPIDLPESLQDSTEIRLFEHSIEVLAAGAMTTANINLLQGDYSYKQKFDRVLKPWRGAMVLVAVIIVLFGAGKVLKNQQLEKQIEDQKSHMGSILKRAFPNVKRIVRPIKQMQTELKKLGATGSDSGFVSVMNHIRTAIESAGNTNLNSISYKTGRVNLDLDTDQLSTLDKLKTSIESNAGYSMKVESANKKDGRIRGRIRIEVKG